MPDLLHALPAAEKVEVAESLTHYLISLQGTDKQTTVVYDAALAATGKDLYHEIGCVACHAPRELPLNSESSPDARRKEELAQLAKTSVPLGNLAKKFTVDSLAAFLRDPLKTRPSGRMPAQRLTDIEARSIAIYLLREQVRPDSPSVKRPGVQFEFYNGQFNRLPQFEKLKPATTGHADKFTVGAGPQKNEMALRFHGLLTVPRAGDYTFWTVSDDGSQLFIDGRLVVDNDGFHATIERDGKARLDAGDHSILVTYFDIGGDRELKVSWAGPGLDRQEISTSTLFSSGGAPMRPIGGETFTVDPVKAAKGKQLFAQLNCAACHEIDQPGRKAAPLEKLAAAEKGCLAADPPADAPGFSLTETQRKELTAALANLSALSQSLSPADQVRRPMTALNCYACHSRDGQGGPSGLRREYFRSVGQVDLGEEGTIPPHLNGVGAKLKPQWLEKVLFTGASVRPYMAARMPQFGESNVKQLAAAFLHADAAPGTVREPVVDAAAKKKGQRLIGTTGLSCISCHKFAGHASLGVPALDLTTVAERLTPDWFHRYLLDPPSLRPGTRMPSFWPGGVAANKTILNGDTEKQINAIWSYLSDGPAADLPPGLIPAKMELVADKEPRVYRNFIAGAGPRAIGVGYPEKLDLAFDANDVRLALLWQGAFIDASRHWSGRGEGFEPPLGYDVVKFPPGAPFAILPSLAAPWPKESGKPAGYQFRGYIYDAQRHPTFRYRFQQIEIEDLFLPVRLSGESDSSFRRTISFQTSRPVANLWFRAAVADNIEDKGNGAFVIDGKVRLNFPASQPTPGRSDDLRVTRPIVRRSGDKFELLAPVNFQGNQAQVMEEISW
jgi:mono/diheme cytochrome c family protein